MWSDPKFLKLCEEFKQKCGAIPLSDGMKVARGFADLGYEEFLLLPGDKLLSLYSGQVTAFPHEHANFFFEVPTADELVDRIVRAFWDIEELVFQEQRRWVLKILNAKSKKVKKFVAPTLEEVLITAISNLSS